jgi:hypothetical protein
MMSSSRAAWYLGGAAVLAGWLAAGADQEGLRREREAADRARTRATAEIVGAEQLVGEIEAQAARLNARLALAPAPSQSGRNPFAFRLGRAHAPPRRPVRAAETDEYPAVPIAEPFPLTLSGMAEQSGPGGMVRIAILSGLGDVFHAQVGDTIASRYRVIAIGAEAIDVEDLTTGRPIRLGLR